MIPLQELSQPKPQTASFLTSKRTVSRSKRFCAYPSLLFRFVAPILRRSRETHAHADHLTAAQYLKQQLGGDVSVGIGQRIGQVQKTFAPVYGYDDPAVFENTFDHYFKDDETFKLGDLSCQVVHLPGHTPDHVGYVIGKAIFTGDSIFNVRVPKFLPCVIAR